MHARLCSAILALCVLAACSGGNRETRTTGVSPESSAIARFEPGGATDVIQVITNDRLALRGAELLDPEGKVVQVAYSIETAQGPRYAGGGLLPSVGVGIGGGGGGGGYGIGSGIGFGFPLGYGAPQSETWSGQTISNAFIRIPDPVGYGQTWRGWKIRVRMGDPPHDLRTLTLDAPPPPP